MRNSIKNSCEVLTICLKIITRATPVFALTCRTLGFFCLKSKFLAMKKIIDRE